MDTAGTASEKPPHVHPRPGEESGDSSGTGPSQSTTSEGNALQKAVEACQRGNLPMLESAFDDGVKAGDVDVEGCALLHWAAINNHCHIMERLISRGAAIDMIGGILKSTPLHWAARVGHLNACVVLVKAGARCDIRDTQGYTPLHLAVQNQFIPIIGYFLKHYPQCIDHTDNSGMTSVMWCAFRILDMFPLRLFVRAGADLGKKESLQGNSALHFAAQERNLSAVRELLRGGADCLAPNNQQETPLDFARNSRNARIIKEMELYARRQGKIPSTFCNRITDNQKLVSIFQFIGPGLFLGTFFLFFHFLHPLLALVLVVLMAIPVKLKLDARTIQSSLIPIGITVAEAVTMAATWSWSMHWWVPWWAQLAFLLSILLLAVSLGRCALGDAGVIPPSTQPYDDLNTLIEEKRLGYFCYTCFVNRPNGAKHCSVCDKCVSNFDHHCPWLNACITRRNQREFLLFVLCVGLSSLIFDSACVAFMLRQLQEIHFGEFLYHFSWLVFTFCLAAIHVFLMTSLFCMQSMQIAQGVTTNQRIKGHRGGYPRHGHSHGGHRRMGDEEEGGDAEAHEGGVVFYIRNCLNFCSGSD